ncbi:UNVERIFIED_CONTAM: hypothetical protein FKN15_056047 [Acipenser sinensis]
MQGRAENAFTFFDPNDPACQEILLDPRTTVPELFAIIRQWVPQVQHKIDVIGNEILKRGCHVNDRDGLTDMTLLHYACKAGAHGVGIFAPVSKISKVVTDQTPSSVTSTPKTPRMVFSRVTGKAKKEKKEKDKEKALRKKSLSVGSLDREGLKIELGDKVLVAGQKQGIIRFYGKTDFAPGYWFGVELEVPTGKHDGSVFGVRYFTCLPKHGVFAPPSRVQRLSGPKDSQSDGTLVKKVHQVTSYWFGVELEVPTGKHDGSVFGVRYFTCLPKHGVFAPPSRVQRLSGPKDSQSDGTLVKKVHQVTNYSSAVGFLGWSELRCSPNRLQPLIDGSLPLSLALPLSARLSFLLFGRTNQDCCRDLLP